MAIKQVMVMRHDLTYIDSWIERDGERCFQLLEAEDEELLDIWTAPWDDLADFEFVPVTH